MIIEKAPVRLYTDFPYNKPNHWLVSAIAVDPSNSGNVIAFIRRGAVARRDGGVFQGKASVGHSTVVRIGSCQNSSKDTK